MKFGFRISSLIKRITARTSGETDHPAQPGLEGPERNGLDHQSQASHVQHKYLYFSMFDGVMTMAVSRYMLNFLSITRGSFERVMYAGQPTPIKMLSKARIVHAIIIKRGGSIGGRVRRIRSAFHEPSDCADSVYAIHI